ncbi:MAG: sugar phosphate isomerase/epimerase [Clostridiaceae bacterium]|nr:sugar phosphate isomerase/epimerase [Clostridiaceae bacterium]
MQIGVSTYSFHGLVQSGKMTQFDVVAKTAEMGFSFIEIAGLNVPAGENAKDYAARLRAECERFGLEIGNYTIGADFLNGSGGDWKAEVQRLHGEVDIAAILGAPGMRHDVTGGRRKGSGFPLSQAPAESFDSVLPVLAQACRSLTEYAADKGIRTMSENHGYFCQDSERVEKLIAATNHPNYGALVDMGNFLCVDENPALAVGRMAPYAFHLHVKDFHFKNGQEPNPGEGWFPTRGRNLLRGAIIGHGIVPVRQCLQIMQQAGYNGRVSIEFEGMEDPLLGIRIGLQNLKAYLQ